MQVADGYVQKRADVWYVGSSGVQALGVIAMWQQGFSPEEIQTSFPVLSLKEIYGTILFYLEQKEEMVAFSREQSELFARRKAEAEERKPAFYAEMRERIAAFRAAQHPHSPSARA
ncbi:MAG: hypothetical protein ACRDHP_03365 [Ktedonobacterales bacterium]